MTLPVSRRVFWLWLATAALSCGGGRPTRAGANAVGVQVIPTVIGAPSAGETSTVASAPRPQWPGVPTPAALPQVGRFGFGFFLAQHPTLPLFAIGSAGDVLLYDRDSPALRAVLPGIGSELRSVTFTPAGQQLLGGTVTGRIVAWDLTTGQRSDLVDLRSPVFEILFAPNGNHVVTVSRNGVRLFPQGLGAGSGIAVADGASTIAFTPNSELLLLRDGALRAVDARSGDERWRLPSSGKSSKHGFALGPDGSELVWSPDNQRVEIVSVSEGRIVRPLARVDGGIHLHWSAEGSRIAIGSRDAVKLLDARTGAPVATLPGARTELLGLSPDGATLGAVDHDDLLLVDAASGATRHRVPVTPRLGTRGWCANGACVIVGIGGREVGRVDARTGQLATGDQAPMRINKFAWAPDGDRFAVVEEDGRVAIASAVDATIRTELPLPHALRSLSSSALAWSPDGKWIAIGSTHELHLFTGNGGRHHLRVFAEPDYSVVRTPRFSPDGRRLATLGSRDGAVRIFEPVTSLLVTKVDNPTNGSIAIAWSPDSRMLALGGHKGAAVVDVSSGRVVYTAPDLGHVLRVRWLDGKRFIAGQVHGSIVVLNLVTRQREAELVLDTRRVHAIDVSADGRFIAGADLHGPVRVWRTDTFAPVADLQGDARELRGLVWHPCKPWLAVVRGGIMLHNVASGSWLRFELFGHERDRLELLAVDAMGRYAGSPGAERHLKVREPGPVLTAPLVEPAQRPDLAAGQIGASLGGGCP